MNVRAYARRWTSRAIEVVFTSRGKEYSTWVWTDAVVEDKEPRQPLNKAETAGRHGAAPLRS